MAGDRCRGEFEPERAGYEPLGIVSHRIIRAAQDAPLPQLAQDACVEEQQVRDEERRESEAFLHHADPARSPSMVSLISAA